MAKVTRIYKPNTRKQVESLTQLVGSQKKHLIEILESIKPAVLTQAVTCDGTNFADLGIYFQLEQNKKYALKVECSFGDADLDGVVQLAVIPTANLREFKFLGFNISSDMSISSADETNNYTTGTQGISWIPSTEWGVLQGYGTMYFQVSEPTIISLSFLAGTLGDTQMLAGSNFTLTEIETND